MGLWYMYRVEKGKIVHVEEKGKVYICINLRPMNDALFNRIGRFCRIPLGQC